MTPNDRLLCKYRGTLIAVQTFDATARLEYIVMELYLLTFGLSLICVMQSLCTRRGRSTEAHSLQMQWRIKHGETDRMYSGRGSKIQ
jgi:hypothetical protein